MAGKPKFLYALYQGEELLCAGTMKELSENIPSKTLPR